MINTITTASAAVWVASTTAPGSGATNNTVKNLIIEGGIGTTANVFGIASKASTALTTSASDNDNLTIQNNAISKVYTGISVTGVNAPTAADGLLVTGNVIGSDDAAKYLTNRGIEVSYANNPEISGNAISNIITTSSNAATGIDLGINVVGGNVVRNNITRVYNTSTGGWNAYGIHFSSATATTNVLVANNFISDIKTVNYNTTSSFNAFGIRISGGTNLKIYNNSIHQFGDVTLGTSAGMSSNIYISSSAATGLEIRNNILFNQQNFTVTGSFVYNIFVSFSGYSFAGINNNDYFGLSSATTTYRVGNAGGTIFYTTLPNWQAYTGQDAGSVSVQPNFTSNTDLHLAATNNLCLDGGGAPLALVTVDHDGQARDASTPDIGADEFVNPNLNISIAEASGVASDDGITCAGASVTLTSNVTGTYLWSTGATTNPVVVSPNATTTYTVTVTDAVGCSEVLSTTITVNPLPTAFAVTGGGAYCAPGAGVPVGLAGSENGVTYQLNLNGGAIGAPVAGTGAALDFGNQTQAGDYTVAATNPTTNCSADMTGSATVTANPTPVSFNVTGGGSYCAPGAGVPVGLSGSESGVNYQLQLGGANLGAPVAGTNAALDFGLQATAGIYTVVATAVNGGCTADMNGSAIVVANSTPTLSETHVEPTTCVAPNGSINLTVNGGTGPFTYNWFTPNGSGLVQGQEDQSGLIVGSYLVTVTDANTCSATLSVPLIGPGNCDACPVISTLNSVPAGACANETITLTASGLIDMGSTYGITFKYYTGAPAANPYMGGTVIATVDNNGLGNGGTTATTTTSFATGGTYFLYAILDQLPTDPMCRPSATYSLTVLNIPSVNAVSSQTVCAGSNTAAVNFSGPVSGTVYDWTNDNPAIGLAASGTGNIASFTAINAGFSPVTATITVTPSVNDPATGTTCTGQSITFTITVNPVPSVNAVSSPTYCNGAAVPSVVFTSNVPGATFAWSRTNEAIGLAPVNGVGNVPAFTATNATTTPLTSTFTVVASYTNNGVTCTGTPIQFAITVNPTPTVSASPTSQTVCNGAATAAINFTGTVGGTVFNWTNNNPAIGLAANGSSSSIPSFTAINNGGAPVTATITVTPTYTNNGVFCSGTPVSVTITVNPTAQVNQPVNVNTCSGTLTAVTFTTTTSGTTYSWTNSNTAIGLAASGTGNISFTAAVVAAATTGTITVTPNYTNNGVSCPGIPRTFTITVNPNPTVNAVPNQPALCSGDATTAITFGGNFAGTVYNWTNSNPSIGLAASGTGNIPSFVTQNVSSNIQTAIITVTPSLTTGGTTCTGTAITFTYTVYPRPLVNVGADITICQNQSAFLAAALGGGATGGTWSGGVGQFVTANAPVTTYIPAASEYGTTVTLTFTSNDPAGPCPSVSDALQLTINTLPLVFAGNDIKVCPGATLDLSLLGSTIEANGSGVTTGTWTSSGSGQFLPSAAFPGAATYVPSAADYAAGFVLLTLTSEDPSGPCGAVSDFLRLGFKQSAAPVCNDNVQVSLDSSGTALIEPDMLLEGTFEYEFYTVSVLQNNQSIGNTVNCTHIGQTLQVRITDICTNNICWGTIKVEDKLPPKMTCNNYNLVCVVDNYDPNYILNTLGVQNAFPTVQENCPPATLVHVDDFTDLDCTQQFSARIRRTWTATDGSGNKSSCIQTINFERRGVNQVLFPSDVTVSCEGGVNTSPTATGAPYFTAFGQNWPILPTVGACEIQTAFVDQDLPVCDGTYKKLRTWTVYDWCLPTKPDAPNQNPQYFIQVIKVEDSSGPVMACPANLTVGTDANGCCASTDLPDVIVEDACSRIKGATARIVVRDPVTNMVLNTYEFNGSIQDFSGNNHWDADTLVAFGQTDCLPLGAHVVTYAVQDDCDNIRTCTYRLTVDDRTAPVPACDDFTNVSLGVSGEAYVNATTFDDGSYDNCGTVSFKARRMDSNGCQSNGQFHDQVLFCCEDIGDTITVVLRVYDIVAQSGSVSLTYEELNSNECMVQVFIEDKIKPFCKPPAHVTVSCENFDPSLWAYGFATAEDNCCVDTITESRNIALFDTVCNRGTLTRTFRAFDCGGSSSSCTQRVTVTYTQDYFVRFPDDKIVTSCNGTPDYGQPTFFGENCELLGVSHEDEVFTVVPDACFKIERTWTVINWCTYDPNLGCTDVPNPNPNPATNAPQNLPGPIISPAGTPAPWNPTTVAVTPGATPTNYAVFYSGGMYNGVQIPNIGSNNCYRYKQIIKVIDTQKPIIANCPASPDTICDITANAGDLWNDMSWWDNTIKSHDLCEAPTDLSITATDLCSDSAVNIRYLLFLDLDGDGTMETVINSNQTGIAGLGWNAVPFGNAGGGAGTLRPFDQRPVPANQKYGFALQTTTSGVNKTGSVRWNTQQAQGTYVVPELPYGVHKIKWFVEDGCGNEQTCEYIFEVKDCKKPTVVCINGLSVNIMPTKMVALWDTDFLQYTEDNCTPANRLVTAIRKAGQGTGFPRNPDGTPQKVVTFTCNELGKQNVELWSIDLAGNADFCLTYVEVQDNMQNCSSVHGTVAGTLTTESGNGLEDATVSVGGLAGTTDGQGAYIVNGLPYGADHTVTPLKDNDPLNGVSTFDLVLINKHILGLEPLNSPYKMIAADANNSRSITTFDIVELRKLILGIYTELPNNTSWRFVDKGYSFPNQSNPFQTLFPETKQIANMATSQMTEDFWSVKVGDVNGNAVTSSLTSTEDRTAGTLLFNVQDRTVKAGEIFTVDFKAAEQVQGYQFTLNHPGLELVDVTPGAEMSMANFGVFAAEQAVTTSWDGNVKGEFSLTFRATTSGELSRMLGVSGRITKAEAYNSGAERLQVGFRFNGANGSTITGLGFELYQNQPNPFVNKTQIGFHLPEATTATLTIFDETGRTMFTQKGDFAKGYNAVTVDRSVLTATGVLFYKIETAKDSAVKTMIQMK
ncbi:MAG: T9SS type A sorting domain-containing protein [Lewinellaceae bacterium]|nr:T9SS type A sorting domain-containing protein [Lewinellaceae bacterium]